MRKLIEVNAIPHVDQRYPSWGDWQVRIADQFLKVDMSELSDWRHLYLGAIHEIIEAFICMATEIEQSAVDKFDFDYERRRVAGKRRAVCGCEITMDPGSDVHAPYFTAHEFANEVEYKLAKLIGVDAAEYDAACVAETEPFEKKREP